MSNMHEELSINLNSKDVEFFCREFERLLNAQTKELDRRIPQIIDERLEISGTRLEGVMDTAFKTFGREASNHLRSLRQDIGKLKEWCPSPSPHQKRPERHPEREDAVRRVVQHNATDSYSAYKNTLRP